MANQFKPGNPGHPRKAKKELNLAADFVEVLERRVALSNGGVSNKSSVDDEDAPKQE